MDESSGICDLCLEFHQFLISRKILSPNNSFFFQITDFIASFVVEQRLDRVTCPADTDKDHSPEPVLKKDQLGIMYNYLGVWVQR